MSASSVGVVELGDSLTLGVSPEAGARVLRDRMALLRNCYSNRQPGNPGLSGGIALRLVVGRDGRVAHARDLGSDVGDASLVQCVVKELRDAYVGVPAEGHFGVIETVVRFRPPLKK